MTLTLRTAVRLAAAPVAALAVLASAATTVPEPAGGAPVRVRATPALPAIRDAVHFTDSFDNGRLDGWQVVDQGTRGGRARWTVAHGKLLQRSNTYSGSRSAADPAKAGTELLGGNRTWRDYDLSVDARTSDDDAVGLVFRYVDRRNYYTFSLDRERHQRRLVATVDGRSRVLASVPEGYARNTTYRLRVRAVGHDLRAFVDGRQVLHAVDAALPRGRFGPWTWGTPAAFDRFTAAARSAEFTIALLPDTQFESQSSPSMFVAQTRWLARNRGAQNIAAVLHEGDVVNVVKDARQWRNARTALNYVAGKIPLTVAAGNHDLLVRHSRVPQVALLDSFNALLTGLPDYRVDGRMRPGDLRNTYQLLDAGGVHFVVLNLTYGASDAQLAWAGRVADRYRDRPVILLTHDYLGQDGQLRGKPGDKQLPSDSAAGRNNGTGIWAKFVRRHANVRFTFNGHVIQPTRPGSDYSVGRRISTNDAGRPVYQLLTNFQSMKRGSGYLRLLRFRPAQHRIDVVTYSPYLHHVRTEPDNRFSITGVRL